MNMNKEFWEKWERMNHRFNVTIAFLAGAGVAFLVAAAISYVMK